MRGAVVAALAMFAAACNTTSPVRSTDAAGVPGGHPAGVPGGSTTGVPGGEAAGNGQKADAGDAPGSGGAGNQSGAGKSEDEILAAALEALDKGAGAPADSSAAGAEEADSGQAAGAENAPETDGSPAGVAGQPGGDGEAGNGQAGGAENASGTGSSPGGVAGRSGGGATGNEQKADAGDVQGTGSSPDGVAGQPGGGATGNDRTEDEILAAALEALDKGAGDSGTAAAGNAEEKAALEKKLNEGLAEFDRAMLGERDAIAGKVNQGGYRGNLDDEKEPLKTAPAESNPGGGRRNAPVPSSGNPQSTPQTPPDLADAEGDDIIARQLREAALKEQDPALREKLWEEYRKYKRDLK